MWHSCQPVLTAGCNALEEVALKCLCSSNHQIEGLQEKTGLTGNAVMEAAEPQEITKAKWQRHANPKATGR
jgi:hypothetical protein